MTAKGINLIAANTGENITKAISDDPMKKALVQIQGVFSELDKSLLVKKLRKARDKIRKEKGRCEGPLPFGSCPGEAAVLTDIRYMRRRHRGHTRPKTFKAIADKLNTRGIKTRQGKKWNAVLVYHVLKNGKTKR